MILQKFVVSTKESIKIRKEMKPLEEMIKLAKPLLVKNLFADAINKEDISYICEVKKASPSKGVLCSDFDYIKIAKEYEKIGANAISVLTEKKYFEGDLKYLKEIQQNVNIPILQKDFIVDEYQIYEARVYGATAILLICTILDEKTIKKFLKIVDSLNMSALVETRDIDEVRMAKRAGAKIIGVNNRNLKTMQTDIKTTYELRKFVDEGILFVSESGIKTREHILGLKKLKVNAVLMGETFMLSTDREKTMKDLKGI